MLKATLGLDMLVGLVKSLNIVFVLLLSSSTSGIRGSTTSSLKARVLLCLGKAIFVIVAHWVSDKKNSWSLLQQQDDPTDRIQYAIRGN